MKMKGFEPRLQDVRFLISLKCLNDSSFPNTGGGEMTVVVISEGKTTVEKRPWFCWGSDPPTLVLTANV